MKLREFYERYIEIRLCAGCRRVLPYEERKKCFCTDCRLKWDIAKTESCPVCLRSAVECECKPRLMSSKKIRVLRKLFIYHAERAKAPQNQTIYYLKDHPNLRVEGNIAEELLSVTVQELDKVRAEDSGAEFVVSYVPRTIRSYRAKGFDQSKRMAQQLALLLGIECVHAVKRVKIGREQKSQSAKQRAENTASQLGLTESAEKVSGKYVILVDDIVTTGASMSECSRLLVRAGAKEIICVSMSMSIKSR